MYACLCLGLLILALSDEPHASSSLCTTNSSEIEILAFPAYLKIYIYVHRQFSNRYSKLWTAKLKMLTLLAAGILMGACTISMAVAVCCVSRYCIANQLVISNKILHTHVNKILLLV